MALGAVVVDSGGNRVEAEPVDVRVTGAPPPSSKQIVYEMPSPGAMLVEKLPHVIRVTSGPRPWCNLSTLDFQVVRFSVDDAPIGECATPRVEIRMANCIPGSNALVPVPVPLWEMSFVPPPGSGGTTASIRTEAIDRNGATVTGEVLLVRIVPDGAPLVTIAKPS
ncbi:MAG TPA: hypothetical protein DFS52_25865, partial [Myxococcales bacterium]|nr:hypothetical protein [Myxococcales bacterium]